MLANGKAQALGITPGMPLNAALALAPQLNLAERNPQKEQRILERLAAWAERFTSMVSMEAPDVLLLEIGGSLQLFGDVENLRQAVTSGLEEQGFNTSVAISPTVLASTWLARGGGKVTVEETDHLSGVLSPLPLHCLDWPEAVRESLNGMGIYCIGDCLRLPREGFARRFGAARLLQLDRALGHLPDPRRSYRSPEPFCEEVELTEEQSDSELLQQVCRQLLSRLERFLTSRQMTVQRIRFSFFHLRAPATQLTIGCTQAGRKVAQWSELLAIRFERLSLPEPVIAIRLRSGRGEALQAATEKLGFDASNGRRPNAPITHLLERLSARMGDGSVYGVTALAEHRPQYAWRPTSPAESRSPQCDAVQWQSPQSPLLLADFRRCSSLLLRRPLWMLHDPLPLATREGAPHYHGPLKLVDGPERLETGWWDDDGIARDYFVATSPDGIHLWIYRNRNPQATWHLHGIFG